MKKKLCSFVSTLLIIALLLPIVAIATNYQEPALPVDVSVDDWFYPHVIHGIRYGLIHGVSKGSFLFEPNRTVTRAEFITMLGRLHEYGNETIGTPDEGLFYERYLNWAVEMRIIHGNENGDLMPYTYLNREQMAVIIYRYIELFDLLCQCQYKNPKK